MNNKNKKTIKHHCEKCNYDTNNDSLWKSHLESNKHKLSKKEYREYKNKVLEESEQLQDYFTEMFKEFDEIESSENIGAIGGKFDVKIKFKNENFYRGIQVKTFTFVRNQYSITLGKKKNKNKL